MTADVDIDAVAAAIRARRPRCGQVRVVAVDGGAAAGKTTLAALLASALADAPVLHTDTLLDGWAGQFTFWSHLREDVLAPLARGEVGSHRRYSWLRGRFVRNVDVPVTPTLLVEGVSAIAACAEAACFGIFLDLPRAAREARWQERDGRPLQAEWIVWLDAEDAVFTPTYLAQADLVVTPG